MKHLIVAILIFGSISTWTKSLANTAKTEKNAIESIERLNRTVLSGQMDFDAAASTLSIKSDADQALFALDERPTIQAKNFTSETLQILAKHRRWQTSVLHATDVPGTGISIIQVSELKKWILVLTGDHPVGLNEETQLSMEPDASGSKLTWSSEIVDLIAPIDLTKFYLLGMQEKLPKKSLRILDGDRFEIISSDGAYRVLFFPVKEAHSSSPVVAPNIGIWTAPLGAAKQATRDIIGLTKNDIAYLHQDLSSAKPVYVDASFPDVHLPALMNALKKWNKALGKDFFYIQSTHTTLDLSDCFSTERLCVRWSGPPTLAWTGIGGSGTETFDPETGEIIGGMITFMNSADESQLKETPAEIENEYRSDLFELKWIAEMYLQRDNFITYRHPMPLIPIESVLLHEIGHFNGLSHNFSGSTRGTARHLTESIMDYFAFPGVRSAYLGDFDLQNLQAMYKGVAPDSSYLFCSDKNSVDGIADCNQFDIGNAANWYMLLAEQGKDSVFTSLPGYGKPILFQLGQFLTAAGNAAPEDRAAVTSYLCSKGTLRDNIKKELMETQNVSLSCDL